LLYYGRKKREKNVQNRHIFQNRRFSANLGAFLASPPPADTVCYSGSNCRTGDFYLANSQSSPQIVVFAAQSAAAFSGRAVDFPAGKE
jgi:hypothetical protein